MIKKKLILSMQQQAAELSVFQLPQSHKIIFRADYNKNGNISLPKNVYLRNFEDKSKTKNFCMEIVMINDLI